MVAVDVDDGAPRTVLIDCDPGHDDAIALLLALARPEWHVETVSIVAGNTTLPNAVRAATQVLTVADRTDVPVHAGMDRPLERALRTAAHVHGESGLEGPVLPEPAFGPRPEHAVDLLVARLGRARDEGRPVEVAATGPLTNLGAALRRDPTIAPYGSFRCRDGWITLAVGSDSLWRRFAPLVGIDPDEPGLATNRDRFLQVEALEARIEAVLRDRDVEEWMTGFERAGIPAGRIRALDEVYAWTQVEHLGLVETVTHPRMGSLRMTGSPIRWSRSGRPESAAPPLLGQDQDLIDDPGGAWRDAPPSGADYLPG